MPEGDTVFRTARRLDQALSGRELTIFDLRVPQHAEAMLVGHVVDETVSRGKHILTRIGDVTLHTHLKMDGSWHVYRPTSQWRRPAFEARAVLANADWQAVGFTLGEVDLVARQRESEFVGHLGPDLLGDDWSADEASRRLLAQPQRPVGAALLDQRNLAGIGNMYRSELCFLSGVHPATPIGQVEALPRMIATAHRLLVANAARSEQTTTGDLARGRRFWVYLRTGQPCLRCRTPIQAGALAADKQDQHATALVEIDQDRSRTSFWCPHCQPAPAEVR